MNGYDGDLFYCLSSKWKESVQVITWDLML